MKTRLTKKDLMELINITNFRRMELEKRYETEYRNEELEKTIKLHEKLFKIWIGE